MQLSDKELSEFSSNADNEHLIDVQGVDGLSMAPVEPPRQPVFLKDHDYYESSEHQEEDGMLLGPAKPKKSPIRQAKKLSLPGIFAKAEGFNDKSQAAEETNVDVNDQTSVHQQDDGVLLGPAKRKKSPIRNAKKLSLPAIFAKAEGLNDKSQAAEETNVDDNNQTSEEQQVDGVMLGLLKPKKSPIR
jgi:hypothetical protein